MLPPIRWSVSARHKWAHQEKPRDRPWSYVTCGISSPVAETCHFDQRRGATSCRTAGAVVRGSGNWRPNSHASRCSPAPPGRLSLTPAGEFLQARSHPHSRRCGRQPCAVRASSPRDASGLVRLGLTGTAAFSHLPRIARVVKRELPGVALEIQADMLTPFSGEDLRSGSLDLGVLARGRGPTSTGGPSTPRSSCLRLCRSSAGCPRRGVDVRPS